MKIFSALVILLTACGASAQTYPTKPIRLVVGFAPGGAADIISRAMSDPLARALGQGIIVDNKPGAGSSLAAEFVARAAPDGYTLMIASQSGMIVNPLINKSIAYDTQRDFAAITQVTSSPLVVAVNPSLPVSSIRELIAEAKKIQASSTSPLPATARCRISLRRSSMPWRASRWCTCPTRAEACRCSRSLRATLT